jgi:hypothetical protein
MPVYINPSSSAQTFISPLGQVFNVASGTSVIYNTFPGAAGQDVINTSGVFFNGNGAGYSRIDAATSSVIGTLNLGPLASGLTLNNLSLAANENLPYISVASLVLSSGCVIAQKV